MQDKVSEMGSDPIGKLLFKYSLPTIAMMLVNGLYNFVDRIFVGQKMLSDGIAATTAGFPVQIIAMALGLLFGIGATSLISIALGKGDKREASSLLGQSFSVSIVLGIVVAALSFVFMDPILKLFGTPDSIMPMAREYLRIIALGFIVQIPQMTIGSTIRAQGRPQAAAFVTVVGVVVNAALAPLFIFAFNWGMTGAALATLIAQVIGFSLTLAIIQGRKSTLKIEARYLSPKGRDLIRMAAIGAPIALVNIISVAILGVANNVMTAYGGKVALAAIGVVNTVAMLFAFPVMGILQGAQSLWGYNFGAKNYDRVREITKQSLVWTTALSVVFTLVIELFPRALASVFNGSETALIDLSARGLSIYLLCFFLSGIGSVPAYFFQSIGKPMNTGILYIGKSLLTIALMLVLPVWFQLDGVLWAGPGSDLAASIVGVVLLFFGLKALPKGNFNEDVKPRMSNALEAEAIGAVAEVL